MKIGYARVSTIEQSLDLQLDALNKAGCETIYSESKSGKNTTDRPEFNKMMGILRRGDTVIVWDLSRMGRSVIDLVNIVAKFREIGVDFISIKNNLDTSTTTGRLQYNIFASLAEYEREMIRDRTIEGLAAARLRGRFGGRPKGVGASNKKKAKALLTLIKSGISVTEAAKTVGLGRASAYRYVKDEVLA